MVRNQEQVVDVGEAEVAQGIEEEGDYSHHQQEGGHPHPGQPCFILSNFFVNYLAIPKSVLVVGTPLQLVKFCQHWYRKIKYLPESFKKLLKSLEISFFGLKNKLGMGNSHVFGFLEYTDIYVNKLLYTE